MTDLVHQREDFKSENDRLKMKVDSQLKEIEKYKYDLKNQRKTYFTAQQQNAPSQYPTSIGASLMSKLSNLPSRQSGYQPGMYQSTKGAEGMEGTAVTPTAAQSDRTFSNRFGTQSKEITQSMDMSKGLGGGFLSQSIVGGNGSFGKTLNVNNNKGGGLQLANEEIDTSVQQNNLLSTPSSRNEDGDMPNMDEE